MKDLLEISCGLDVTKDKIAACASYPAPSAKPLSLKFSEFATLIPDTELLYATGLTRNCHHVAMEKHWHLQQPIVRNP
ncbi:MAG: hypothetical protein ACLRZZ_05950 [Enterocloster sp.]